jgi:hypothetical protein
VNFRAARVAAPFHFVTAMASVWRTTTLKMLASLSGTVHLSPLSALVVMREICRQTLAAAIGVYPETGR